MPFFKSLRNVPARHNDRTALEPEHIEGFRRCQQVAYACVTAVEQELREGMTEKDAARALGEKLRDQGVREYFHQPFAWFGDRTAFSGFVTPLQFFPTRKRLLPGMPVILDVAPILDGHTADIGYACKLGDNAAHDQMLLDLAPYRELILAGVRARKQLDAIYREVDALIVQQGYKNRHQQYPFRVLGHRVAYVPEAARTKLKVAGFGMPAISYIFGQMAQAKRGIEHHSPLWNDARQSAHPAEPGIWAVEPHIGCNGVGVKWEELLVVTDDDAYWLDDDLPHVRRFATLATARTAPVAAKAVVA